MASKLPLRADVESGEPVVRSRDGVAKSFEILPYQTAELLVVVEHQDLRTVAGQLHHCYLDRLTG